MARMTLAEDNRVKKFSAKFFEEFVSEGKFEPYMGSGSNNIIFIKEGLQEINIPLLGAIDGDGVVGSQTLTGNEVGLDNYSMKLVPTYHRQGVTSTLEDLDKPAFDLLQASRDGLMIWAKNQIKYAVVEGLGGVRSSGSAGVYYNYGDAPATTLDSWQAANTDRILYGIAKSNLISGDHTGSLANVDTTNDKLTASMVTLVKRMAKNTNPKIRPYQTGDGNTFYVFFVDSYGFRDLSNDTTIAQANRDARERGLDNPVFTGGDLLYNGVIIREIEEITEKIDGTTGTNGAWGGASTADKLTTAGAASTRVGVGFLVGQQALGYGLGMRPTFRDKKEDDYDFQPGVAVMLKFDIKKAFFNSKQNSVVTVFYSASVDS